MVLVDYAVIGYFITLGVFVKIVVGQIYPKLILKTNCCWSNLSQVNFEDCNWR